jgi:hypothetical protein
LVQKRVVFFPIFSRKRIFSQKYVGSTYFANAQLTPPLYDVPISRQEAAHQRQAVREGRRRAEAYVKVFRHLQCTTALTDFLGEAN